MNKPLSLVAFSFFLFISFTLPAQTSTESSQALKLGRTQALRDLLYQPDYTNLAKKRAKKREEESREVPNFPNEQPKASDAKNPLPQGKDPLWEPYQEGENNTNFFVLPNFNIDGLDEAISGVLPPDPCGDVGFEYYMQAVNATQIQVFDKQGNPVAPPFGTDMFWADFGLQGFGDPIVLFDETANRWVITEFASIFDNTLFIAVSETSDPLGSYFVYEFLTPNFPDYPKYGIWPNAYYLTTNEGQDPNMPIYFFDRPALLNGEDTISVQRLGFPKFNPVQVNAFQIATPADWDGSAAPPDDRMFILRMYDDGWGGNLGEDRIEIWEASIDWDNPGNSFVQKNLDVITAPFNSLICGTSFTPCLPQANSPVSLFPLDNILMHPVTYRNFGTHEAMVLCFTVSTAPGGPTGIRWMELRRNPGQDWEVYQEGTHGTQDGVNAFMPSININVKGDLALGYSVTAEDISPGLRMTGRRASDPLGSMTVNEIDLAEGLSSNSFERWGDYACMQVDPANGATFWFTGEYMKEDNLWGTKITNIQIQRDTFDIGPIQLVAPANSTDLGTTETVAVQVRNFGLEPVHDFELGFIFDDAANTSEIQMVTDTLQPDSSRTVNFSTTVDLSTAGTYSFRIFTQLDNDQLPNNDTLRVTVDHFAERDLTVTDFPGLNTILCDTFIEMSFLNLGRDTLTSAQFIWEIPPFSDTLNWTGTLPFQEIGTISWAIPPSLDGPQTITAYPISVNGADDEIPQNDTLVRDFTVAANSVEATLILQLDNFPEETSWTLIEQGGPVIGSGGPYPGQPEAEIFETFCLQSGNCYIFRIQDSFGDGLFFPGGYVIINQNGETLASLINPNFGNQEINTFCVSDCINLGANITLTDQTDPVNPNGSLLVEPFNATGQVTISVDGTPIPGNFLDELSAGDYIVSVADQAGCIYTDTVTIKDLVNNVIDLEQNIQILVSPNPARDRIAIQINGLENQLRARAHLYDLQGRRVASAYMGSFSGVLKGQIDLEDLPAGLYLLRLEEPLSRNMIKVVKQ